jgi:outer membrane protein assembly factor BamB
MIFVTQVYTQDTWEQFRGPKGSAKSMGTIPLPVEFGEGKNMLWKTEISYGLSSPCVWGNRIFLTGIEGTELETVCIDRNTGDILWRRQAWYEFIERVHRSNSPATPTPATDGERVYVYLGSCGLLCYDNEGNEIWTRIMRTPPNLYGSAGSLILAKGNLIFCNDNMNKSTLEAIDPKTGETIWLKERKNFKASWTTPVFWNNNGVDELLINGTGFLKAYSLTDGEERWSLPGMTDEPCVTPAVGEGLVFITSYNMKTNTEAIRPPLWEELLNELDTDGDGELTLEETKPNQSILSRADADGEGDHPLWGFHPFLDSDKNGKLIEKEWQGLINWINTFPQENALIAIEPGDSARVLWKYEKGVPECPSPLYINHRVYMVKNGGLVTCVDAQTGDLKFSKTIGAGGPYYASPIAGDGKIYTASTRGVVSVLKVGDTLKILAQNDLGERIGATPAIVDGKIYVRTDKHLFAFGLK